MNAPEPHPISSDSEQQMRETLALQRDSYIAEGEVSAATRIDRIQRTIEVLVQNAEKISEAMNADFGCRPRQVNLMTDVTGSLENLKHAKKHHAAHRAHPARPPAATTAMLPAKIHALRSNHRGVYRHLPALGLGGQIGRRLGAAVDVARLHVVAPQRAAA